MQAKLLYTLWYSTLVDSFGSILYLVDTAGLTQFFVMIRLLVVVLCYADLRLYVCVCINIEVVS